MSASLSVLIAAMAYLLGAAASSSSSVSSSSSWGQVIGAYYSGVGIDSLGEGGMNTLYLAFFDPSKMTASNCDFTDPDTPCVYPAPGAGTTLDLGWIEKTINSTAGALSGNTAPLPGSPPLVFISFGGANQGGAAWDQLFSEESSASQFGSNCAALIKAVSSATGNQAVVGIDLDIEETSTDLPYFGAFMSSFRSLAPYNSSPLQMCTLSGVASPDNPDYFKMDLFKQYGPDSGGLTHINFMVTNQDESCNDMADYWLNPSLSFLPNSSIVWGSWGENLPSYILHDPGCSSSSGSYPALFPYMSQGGIGLGVWEWWSGDTTQITAVANAVRSSSQAPASVLSKGDPAATFAFTYTDDKNQVDFYTNVTAEGYKAVYVYAGDVETYCRGVAGSSPDTECIWSGSEQNSWVYYTTYAQDTAAKYAKAGFQVFLNFDGRINQKGSPGYVADFSLMTTTELQGMATATAYG